MDKQNKRSTRYTGADAAGSSRPIRTTASYMKADKPEPADENESRRKKTRRIKSTAGNENARAKPSVKKILAIAGAVLAMLVILLAVIFAEPGTHHQMPTVTTPAPTEVPEGAV